MNHIITRGLGSESSLIVRGFGPILYQVIIGTAEYIFERAAILTAFTKGIITRIFLKGKYQ